MSFFKKILFFWLVWLPAFSFSAQDLFKKRLSGPEDRLGVFIGYPDQPLITINPDLKLIPASVSKIVTALSVLEGLGVATTVKTEICTPDEYHGEAELKSPLVFLGGGDPGFVTESMWALVNHLSRLPLKKIIGPIWIDDRLFDDKYFSDTRIPERASRAFDAPVSAASFNWNSVNVWVFPNRKGELARVHIDPNPEIFKINNQIKTGDRDELSGEVQEMGNQLVLNLRGSISIKTKEKILYVPIKTPWLWVGLNLRRFLEMRGFKVFGQIARKPLDSEKSCFMLASWESRPVWHMVADMNKFSNNFVAEILTQHLSIKNGGSGSVSHGVKMIEEWLEKKGFQKGKEFEFINPSGLTRENRLTPRLVVQLLAEAKNHFQYGPEFLMSMPLSGIDGTLKKRQLTIIGKVRAKTGYLNQVVALAGYFQKSSNWIPFAFLYNGPNTDLAKSVIDEFLEQQISQ